MQRLETTPVGEEWRYTLDGKHVSLRVMEDFRAPHPGIWVDGRRLYDVEWTIQGRRRATIPARSSETESVYDAYDSGDWSAIPRPTPVQPGAVLEAAEEAVRGSAGWRAKVRWSHVSRIITIAHRNGITLTRSLDRIEGHAAPFEQLSLEQQLDVLGRQVVDSRLVGARPPSAVWRRSVL